MKQAWLDTAGDEQTGDAWERYVATPPETTADALGGFDHVLDHIDGDQNGLTGLRDMIVGLRRDLQSSTPVPDLARRLRMAAELAYSSCEPTDADFVRILESIAIGMARPRLIQA